MCVFIYPAIRICHNSSPYFFINIRISTLSWKTLVSGFFFIAMWLRLVHSWIGLLLRNWISYLHLFGLWGLRLVLDEPHTGSAFQLILSRIRQTCLAGHKSDMCVWGSSNSSFPSDEDIHGMLFICIWISICTCTRVRVRIICTFNPHTRTGDDDDNSDDVFDFNCIGEILKIN